MCSIIPTKTPRPILLAVLLIVSFLTYGQEERVLLYEGEEPFNTTGCLSKNLDYDTLNLVLQPAETATVKKVSLTLILDEKYQEYFDSFRDFDDFDLKGWLKDNDAFKDVSRLKFDFLLVYEEGAPEKYSFELCVSKHGELPTMSGEDEEGYVFVPVCFATDRNYDKNADLDERFGIERSSIKYGYCDVSVPYSHKVGQIESPSLWRFEIAEDPKKHIVVHTIKTTDKESFFRRLSNRVNKSYGKSTFLFVHGYNVSFIDAAKRTAQIAYDLKFDGVPVFYSWPSKASTGAYTNDEATIEWSKLNMEHFLTDYLEKSEANEIYLIAHSMGNRGLTKALISVISERPELKTKIREIILAAPDIDADVFKRDIAPRMVSKIQKPITLYVSSEDVALKASKAVHGNPRAGDSEEGLTLVEGVETIDATGTDTSFLGHSYFVESRTVLDDLFDLINNAKRASFRRTLQKGKLDGKVFWKIKTEE